MLTPAGCRARVRRLLEAIDASIEAVLVARPEHVFYFCNHLAPAVGINHRAPTYLLIECDGTATLVLDGFVRPAEGVAVDAVVSGGWRVDDPAVSRYQATAQAVAETLQHRKLKRLGAEAAYLPHSVARAARDVIDVEPVIGRLRLRRDPDELDAIVRAIAVGEALHAASRLQLAPGTREIDFYAAIVHHATQVAEQPFVMMCDLASGPRVPGGGSPSARRIEAGDNVLIDVFPYLNGYRCDITNTLNAGGRPSAEQVDAFAAALEAMRAAERLIAPGVPASELFRAVDGVFRRANPAWRLVHHAGHALGLEHPEPPDFLAEIDTPIVEGMVITLEPGVYGPSFHGVRIEHNYLVTKDGYQRLSNHALGLA